MPVSGPSTSITASASAAAAAAAATAATATAAAASALSLCERILCGRDIEAENSLFAKRKASRVLPRGTGGQTSCAVPRLGSLPAVELSREFERLPC